MTQAQCPICKSRASVSLSKGQLGAHVDCPRCGKFGLPDAVAGRAALHTFDQKKITLAAHLIQKMQKPGHRVSLTPEFFEALQARTLPSPSEACDNLLLWLAAQADGQLGTEIRLNRSDPELLSILGVMSEQDAHWLTASLNAQELISANFAMQVPLVNLTIKGWQRVEELKRAHTSSRFAFFARRFENADLDVVFERCLTNAVEETGYELRTVTQKAGLIDPVMEDEIRRCRFLIADLSDTNDGAYWEAGFAEGLGKPVIYICRAGVRTHFDANHRQTVRWDLQSLDETATKLKAVIRNTLLGDARQPD